MDNLPRILPYLARLFLIMATIAVAQQSSPTVSIANGTVKGFSLPEFSQDVFLGIPYAQSTAGQNRLRVPQYLNFTFANNTFDATSWGHTCPGFGISSTPNASYGQNYVPGEDCLNIQIIRPSGVTNTSGLPILFWIFGGGLVQGTAQDPRYNGSYIVQRSVAQGQPIIFASINYRLSAFGFPAGQEALSTGNLNLGLRDQRQALQWVQENIKQFGGDPAKVVIWGQSAGGISVTQQLAAYGGRNDGLFRGAIVDSGFFSQQNSTLSSQAATWNTFVNASGCLNHTSQLTCLRELSFKNFSAAAASYSPSPIPDGDFVLGTMWNQYSKGAVANVPLIAGANRDEATSGIGAPVGSNDIATLRRAMAAGLSQLSPSNATLDKILTLYPDQPYLGCPFDTGDGVVSTGFQDKRSNALWTDFVHAGIRHLLSTHAAAGNPTWSFRFNQVPQNGSIDGGVAHLFEIPYIYGITNQTVRNPLGNRAGDLGTSEMMQTFWINFVNNLDPNTGNPVSPQWPSYDIGYPQNLAVFNNNTHVQDDTYRNASISFLQALASGSII